MYIYIYIQGFFCWWQYSSSNPIKTVFLAVVIALAPFLF